MKSRSLIVQAKGFTRFMRELWQQSVAHFLARTISEKVNKVVESSAVYHFFTEFEDGRRQRLSGFDRVSALTKKAEKTRLELTERFTQGMSQSIASTSAHYAAEYVLSASGRSYGLFLMIFALTQLIIYLVDLTKSGAQLLAMQSYSAIFSLQLLIPLCISVISLPLFLSGEPILKLIRHSRLLGGLLFRFAGLRGGALEKQYSGRDRFIVYMIAGIALGLLTMAIPILQMTYIAIWVLLALMIFKSPEFGVLALLFAAPMTTQTPLVALATLSVLSFGYKFMRGKRSIQIGAFDLCVAAFMVLVIASALWSDDPAASLPQGMMYVIFALLYFVIVNSFITQSWIQKGIVTLLCSVVLVSLSGVIQFLLGTAAVDSAWVDASLFGDLATRVYATLDNPNILAEYLILVLPFFVAALLSVRRVYQKAILLAGALVVSICLLLTASRGAWLGVLVALALFFLFYSKNIVKILFCGLIAVPVAEIVMPGSIINRFLSMANFADTSILHRFTVWGGTWNMICDNLILGVGVGSNMFAGNYPRYALTGATAVAHCHNVYLQILAELGLFGFIAFMVLLVTFLRTAFSAEAKIGNRQARALILAGACALIGLLVMGFADYVFYDCRIFINFWMILGLMVTTCRVFLKKERTVART